MSPQVWLIFVVFAMLTSHVQLDENGKCSRKVSTTSTVTVTNCKEQDKKSCKWWCTWRMCKWIDICITKNERCSQSTKPSITYKLETYCCPGFFKNESLNENGFNCVKGCSNNTYGLNCSSKCNCPHNAYAQCDYHNGTCACNEGWTGINCTVECPEGYFGSDCSSSCSCQNNSTCERFNGSCNCTDPGWTGISCDEECRQGTYGYNCSETCSCSVNETCDPRTGDCSCEDGLTGTNCSEICSNDTYGRNCSKQCSCYHEGTESCDSVDGSCNCKTGKTGNKCEYECYGTYGDGCKNNCSCNIIQEYCRPTDGKCFGRCFCAKRGTANCDESYNVFSCNQTENQKCNATDIFHNRFIEYNDSVVDTCACKNTHDTVCVPNNGSCSCNPGYTGEWCKDECRQGTYGYNCSETCSCSVNETCDPRTGKCRCEDGMTGTNCSEGISNPIASAKSSVKDNNYVIIGSIIGSLVAVVLIATVVLVLLRKTTCKKKKKPVSSHTPALSESPNTNEQLYEKAKVPQAYEKAKAPQTHEKGKDSSIYEKAKVPQTYEKAKAPQTYEKGKDSHIYEKAKVPQTYGKAKAPQTYDKLKVLQTYEKANVPQTYEMAKDSQLYEKAKVPQKYGKAKDSQTYEKAKVPQKYGKAKDSQAYEKAKIIKYRNGAFEDTEMFDGVYNKLNHGEPTESSDYSNDNQSNTYDHMMTSNNTQQDGDYDLMMHIQRQYTADENYDHPSRMDNMYDSAVHYN